MTLKQLLALEERIKADYRKVLDDRAELLNGIGDGVVENVPDCLTRLMHVPDFKDQCYSLRQHLVSTSLARLHRWFMSTNDMVAADAVWLARAGITTYANEIIRRLFGKQQKRKNQ